MIYGIPHIHHTMYHNRCLSYIVCPASSINHHVSSVMGRHMSSVVYHISCCIAPYRMVSYRIASYYPILAHLVKPNRIASRNDTSRLTSYCSI